MISSTLNASKGLGTLAEPLPEPFVLNVLRRLPPLRGKNRVARKLLTWRQKNQCTLIVDRFGNKLVVPNMLEPVGLALGVNGSYEPDTIAILRKHLNSSLDFVDVGANIGTFSVALAPHVRRVFAIEASPIIFPFLLRNIELSGHANIDVIDCALSRPGIGEVPFFIPPMDHFGMGSSAAQFDVQPILIKAQALDNILDNLQAGRVGAMKVDVEGFEAHVFQGALELLTSSNAPIVAFEFCDWAEERAFPGRRGWAQQIMLDVGYKLWPLPEYRRNGRPLSKPITEGSHNIIACKS